MTEENERNNGNSGEDDLTERPAPAETGALSGWREIFRQAFDKARRENPPTNRRNLGRDRSRSLFLLAGSALAVLLLFLGVFSSPNRLGKPKSARSPGTPDLGQRVTPGQKAAGQTGSATPLLSVQTAQSEAARGDGVTAEDVDKTARPIQPSASAQPRSAALPVPGKGGPYALGQIDFSDPAAHQRTSEPATSAKPESDDLRKPSLVFVRNVQSGSAGNGTRATTTQTNEGPATLVLPPGTKLIARLESVVTSAIKSPVVAAIEYNYEREGDIIVPAGARALGSLQQADRSGNVAIRFDSIQMPDGLTARIDATAMSLNYGPLKGIVSGKKTGTNFLVRTFTGLGQAATYLVGSGGPSAPLSESAFLRDRIATNVGIAGDQELNNLTFNQDIVVTVPGNTRFYVVMEPGTARAEGQAQPASTRRAPSASLPSVEDLRQLLQLRQEMSAMYQQAGTQGAVEQAPQQ